MTEEEYRANKIKEKKIAAVRQLMHDLINETNSTTMEKEVIDGLVGGLLTSHRTLQQSFMRAFVGAMNQYAETETDIRNAASVELAGRIVRATDDLALPYS